jgi:hypothetical protein
MGNACSFTVNIDNKLASDLTLNGYENPPAYGNWDSGPETTITANTNKEAGKVLGKTCSTFGAGANMTYGIPDGTTFIINFMSPYGSSSPTLSATPSGPRAGLYSVSSSSVSGYNPSGTVTITLK